VWLDETWGFAALVMDFLPRISVHPNENWGPSSERFYLRQKQEMDPDFHRDEWCGVMINGSLIL